MMEKPQSSALTAIAVVTGTALILFTGSVLLDSGVSERSAPREEHLTAAPDDPENENERLAAAAGRHSDSAFDTSFNSQSDSSKRISSAGHSENKKQFAENNDTPNDEDDHAGNTVSDARPRRLTPEIYTDRRVHLNPSETVEIILPKYLVDSSLPVTIRSEDGGVVEGMSLTPEMTFEAGHIPESFHYTVGRHRGLYVVSIYYGQTIERLEFWAGEPLPQGKPGPSRNITPPERQETAE